MSRARSKGSKQKQRFRDILQEKETIQKYYPDYYPKELSRDEEDQILKVLGRKRKEKKRVNNSSP